MRQEAANSSWSVARLALSPQCRLPRACSHALLAWIAISATPSIIHAQVAPTAVSPVVDNPLGLPDLRQIAPPAKDAQGVGASISILVLMTVIALSPAILVMTTCFTRIIIVLALLRQAMGTQTLPPSQVITGLALVMTAMVMAPTWHRIQVEALDPYLAGRLGQREALNRAADPLRKFMIRQIETAQNEEDVYMFVEHAHDGRLDSGTPLRWRDVHMWELVPGFVLSELKVAFLMGFRMYLPFLVIDMVISAILISMGMLMLPPVLISLPFKLLLFVMADGWHLVIGSLVQSFG